MQQALNLNSNSGDEFSIGLSTAPLTDAEFTDFRDGIGTLIKVDEFRQRIFHGGLEPSLRFVGIFFTPNSNGFYRSKCIQCYQYFTDELCGNTF